MNDVVPPSQDSERTAVERITKLEAQLEETKKGLIGRVERFGIIIGVIGAVFSVLLGLFSLPKAYEDFRSKPETKVVGGWPLRMSYNPQGKNIGFNFTLKVANDGAADDTITEVRANLKSDELRENNTLYFSPADLKFMEKGVDVRPAFNVGITSPRELACSISSEIGDTDLVALRRPALWHLVVELIAENKQSHSAEFCFRITNGHIQQVFDSTSEQSINYVAQSPQCEGK